MIYGIGSGGNYLEDFNRRAADSLYSSNNVNTGSSEFDQYGFKKHYIPERKESDSGVGLPMAKDDKDFFGF